jgi:hypothetical protein
LPKPFRLFGLFVSDETKSFASPGALLDDRLPVVGHVLFPGLAINLEMQNKKMKKKKHFSLSP